MGNPQATNPKELVRRISEHLHAAADVASAAEAFAGAGDTDQALAMLRDLEPRLYEATTLLNAASMLRGNHTR